MEVPQSADINRLKHILGASRAIMHKVDTGDYSKGNIDSRALTDDGIGELMAEGVTRPAQSQDIYVAPAAYTQQKQQLIGEEQYVPFNPHKQQSEYTDEMVRQSKLPDSIKAVMINKKIPPAKMPNTFTLNDVKDLITKEPQKKRITETVLPKAETNIVDKYELNEMITNIVNEKLLEFFTKSYNKKITEDAISKTIKTLISEGKLLTPNKKI